MKYHCCFGGCHFVFNQVRLISKKIENCEVLKLREMHFALRFRSQRKFFVDFILPGETYHRRNFKKIEKNLEKLNNFEVLKWCEMHFALGFSSQREFLLNSSCLVGLIIEQKTFARGLMSQR